jgi:hypothetical protein
MDIEDSQEQQAAIIAKEWGVDVDTLSETFWELEENALRDGTVIGYWVRFDDETERETLNALGVPPGEFIRSVSLNAFDQPDYDE